MSGSPEEAPSVHAATLNDPGAAIDPDHARQRLYDALRAYEADVLQAAGHPVMRSWEARYWSDVCGHGWYAFEAERFTGSESTCPWCHLITQRDQARGIAVTLEQQVAAALREVQDVIDSPGIGPEGYGLAVSIQALLDPEAMTWTDRSVPQDRTPAPGVYGP